MFFTYFISKRISLYLLKKDCIEEQEYSACLYCIDYILELLNFFVVSLGIGIIFGIPLISFIYFGVLFPIRSICGGYHASSRWGCTILSLLFLGISIVLTNMFVSVSVEFLFVNMTVCCAVIFFQKKILTRQRSFTIQQQNKQAFYRKLVSILLMLIFMILSKLEFTRVVAMIVSCTDIAIINMIISKVAVSKREKLEK